MIQKLMTKYLNVKTSSLEDEEAWLELQFYEDQKHLDDVSKK